MAKKVFYNRRYKMPAWGQLYAVWSITAAVALGILFFTSVEKVSQVPAPQVGVTLNGFAEGLFYELRDAESGSQNEIILSYAKRLDKKHGYKIREELTSGCKTIRITRGGAPAYGIAAHVEGEKSQAAFALLTFLDRVLAQNAAAALDAKIIFAAKNCGSDEALAAFASEGFELPLVLDTGEVNQVYDRIPDFKNLKLRRHFEKLFFMRDRTLWADVMAILAVDSQPGFVVPMAGKWTAGPEAELAQNPLLKHPVVAKISGNEVSHRVAVYLAADYQLLKGGFIAFTVLFWLLAVIPFANALGTFRERLDLGSALTSSILYGVAFFGYLLLLKLVLNFARSDFAVTLLSVLLLPVVFIPVRILQKSVLRAELNRPGLHSIVQILLTAVLFINPLMAFYGFICLMIASGFSRADAGRKVLRLILLMLAFTAFFFATRQPLGSFSNFFAALMPAFSAAGIFKMLLVSFIGGNLVALFFVPRERV